MYSLPEPAGHHGSSVELPALEDPHDVVEIRREGQELRKIRGIHQRKDAEILEHPSRSAIARRMVVRDLLRQQRHTALD